MVTLLRNIEDTGSEISRHISDNFSRIGLIDHVNQHGVGEVYRNDPLKRIFINFKRSGAYQHYKRDNVKCHFLCTRYKLNDDVATILHEASHTAINTRDFLSRQQRGPPAA